MKDRHYDVALIGGGHAQLAVLRDWAINGKPSDNAVLIDPAAHARYSGTVPGIIAGAHKSEHGQVDLAALCNVAGIDRIEQRVIAIDPEHSGLTLESGEKITFGIASIDTGGVGRASSVLGSDPRLLDIRPIDAFIAKWTAFAAEHAREQVRIAVVGGGAGGVELAFALRNAAEFAKVPQVVLIAGRAGLLPEFGTWPRGLIEREFERQGIPLIEQDAGFSEDGLHVGGARFEPVDLIVAAIGSGAPEWPGEGGLDVDENGFISIGPDQRSTSHPNVFASGDVAQRMDRHVPHSGVHAVHTGPVLAANLRAVAGGREPEQSYKPRPASLYLLSTGQGQSVMAYGILGAQGDWAQKWKDRIDKRWLDQYAVIEDQA